MKEQIFLSHTKYDRSFCDYMDSICARVGMKSFRSEYERIDRPQCYTIREAVRNSYAVFLLIGKKLVELQQISSESDWWKHVQNWIAFEIGVACAFDIDVWVISDEEVDINFPVPYLNNYIPGNLVAIRHPKSFDFLRSVLEDYKNGVTFPFGGLGEKRAVTCRPCGAEFNIHYPIESGDVIRCPQCLRRIEIRI